MLGWSIIARAWRSASKRATTCLVSIPGLMTFRATLRRTGCDLLGDVDDAHAAFADLLPQLVGADDVTRALGEARRFDRDRRWRHGELEEAARLGIAGEESLDAPPQLGIAASLIQEGRPGVPVLDLEGRKEDLFEIRCCLVHWKCPRRRMSLPIGQCEKRRRQASPADGFSRILVQVPGSPQLVEQPGLGVTPVALDRRRETPSARAASSSREAGEVAQLDELGLDRVVGLELRQRLVEGQEVLRGGRGRDVDVVELLACPLAAMLLRPLAAGIFDQDAAHGLGGRGEEVTTALPPLDVIRADQTEIRLVHQRRGLEGLARLLLRQPLLGEAAQLAVDERQEFTGRGGSRRARWPRGCA